MQSAGGAPEAPAAAAEQTLLEKNRAFWAQQKGYSHIVFDAFVYVPPRGD